MSPLPATGGAGHGRVRAVVSGVVSTTQWVPGSDTDVGKHTGCAKVLRRKTHILEDSTEIP